MLDDRIAEHVPGCNMAFRRDALLAADGFNPVYVRAGDDVDICWRLQAKKLDIGFRTVGVGLAPSPSERAIVLASAGRVRRGGGVARRASSREVSRRADGLAWAHLQPAPLSEYGGRATRQHGRLGYRGVSVDLQHAGPSVALPAPLAGVDGGVARPAAHRRLRTPGGHGRRMAASDRGGPRGGHHRRAVRRMWLAFQPRRSAPHRTLVHATESLSVSEPHRVAPSAPAAGPIQRQAPRSVTAPGGCTEAHDAASVEVADADVP